MTISINNNVHLAKPPATLSPATTSKFAIDLDLAIAIELDLVIAIELAIAIDIPNSVLDIQY